MSTNITYLAETTWASCNWWVTWYV